MELLFDQRAPFVFIEVPHQMNSIADWYKLGSRLIFILENDKHESSPIPLLFGKGQSGIDHWQKFLNGYTWPWESETPLKNTQDSSIKELDIDSNEIPLIGLFSSGSTGIPKCILHKQSSLVSSAKVSGELLHLKEGDHLITSLPFFHMGGLLTGLRSLIFHTEFHLCTSFELTNQVNELFTQNPKNICVIGVPAQLPMISPILKEKAPITAGQFTFYAGGDQVRPHKWQAILDTGASLIATYGQSESCGAILFQEGPDKETKVYPDCKIDLSNDGTFSYRCERLAHSILTLKVNSVHQTLLRNSVFFETADLVKVHSLKEGKNRIEFVGRKDQLFQCGGEMISPNEILERVRKTLERLALNRPRFHGLHLNEISIQGLPDDKLGMIPVGFIKGMGHEELETLARELSQTESGPGKLRFLSPYPDFLGIKPSKDEFLASYQSKRYPVSKDF